MSTSMYWAPTPEQPPEHTVPDRLHRILARRIWGEDGTDARDRCTLTGDIETVAWFQGLRDAGVEGAAELLTALRHATQSIDIWIER